MEPNRTIRLVVTGDRAWTDLEYIKIILHPIIARIDVLIEGEANGVDKLCKQAALDLGLPQERILEYPTDWYPALSHGKFFKGAGIVRNQQMIREGEPNSALAFHPNIVISRGTKDMLFRLVKADVATILYDGKSLTGTVVDKQFLGRVFPPKRGRGRHANSKRMF